VECYHAPQQRREVVHDGICGSFVARFGFDVPTLCLLFLPHRKIICIIYQYFDAEKSQVATCRLGYILATFSDLPRSFN
jgi:hypothetical protein